MTQEVKTLIGIGAVGLLVLMSGGAILIRFLLKKQWENFEATVDELKKEVASIRKSLAQERERVDTRFEKLAERILTKQDVEGLERRIGELNNRIDAFLLRSKP